MLSLIYSYLIHKYMLYICKLDRLVLCMKTIGIIGGMSYESSIHYYERINKQVNEIMGDLNCA